MRGDDMSENCGSNVRTTRPEVDDLSADTSCGIDGSDPAYWFTKGQIVWSSGLHGLPPQPQPCDTCTNEGSCKRIGQCLRYKCEFGSVDKP